MRLMPSLPTSTNPRFAMSSRGPARDLKRPSQDMAFTADHPHPTSGSVRGAASRTLKEWAGMRLMSSLPTNTKLEGSTCTEAHALPPVFPFPSPLKALRERGIKGERVPLRLLRHAKSPENPLGVIQSNQLRVQSTFNQNPTPNRVPYPFSLSSSCCSDFSSWCCRYATVRSPLVRSTTPRTMSVVRLRPDVIPSGKSIVVSAV